MQITKKRFTEIALGFVETGKDYDHEEIVLRTAIELAGIFYDEFYHDMTIGDIEDLRKVFKGIARNVIDWKRLNRKAHPEEWADSIKYDAWPEVIRGYEV